MLNVPKKANDAMHLSLLEGCDISADKLGEVVLQDAFSVWDPKQLIRKGRDRHIFLFEMYLLFTKEVKDSAGKVKYIYKNKLMVCIFFTYPLAKSPLNRWIFFCINYFFILKKMYKEK